MRLPGAPDVTAPDLEPWPRPDGPMVLPGSYQVRLTVGEHRLVLPFEIEPDPRITASWEDLQAQFELLQGIIEKLSLTNVTINQIDALLAQAKVWEQRTAGLAGGEAVRRALAGLQGELHAIRGTLIDVHMQEAQLWPSGLHEKFNALFDAVDSADYVPTGQSREVFAELSAQLDELVERLRRVLDEQGGALNAAIRDAGLAPIGLSA